MESKAQQSPPRLADLFAAIMAESLLNSWDLRSKLLLSVNPCTRLINVTTHASNVVVWQMVETLGKNKQHDFAKTFYPLRTMIPPGASPAFPT